MSRIPRTGLLVLGGVVVGMQAAVAYELEHIDLNACLLYTSDAADDLLCVDLGGRRVIKKKHNKQQTTRGVQTINTLTA